MKILHITNTEKNSGAGIVAYRLHDSLRRAGIDSAMLVASKQSNDPDIYPLHSTLREKMKAKIFAYLNNKIPNIYKKRPYMFSPLLLHYGKLHKHPLVQAADIIVLHWVADGMLKLPHLAKFNKPIIWRLADMWPLSGGCHYAMDCERYKEKCGCCPMLNSHKEWDLSRLVWYRKSRLYPNANLTVVTPCQWMADAAKASSLFRDRDTHVIPSGIDTELYRPIEQREAKKLLQLPLDKKLILFCTLLPKADIRKGYHYFKNAVNTLDEQGKLVDSQVVLVGTGAREISGEIKPSVICFDKLSDEISLILLLSAVDVIVMPSLADNLPNMALEAMACGCPVVSFDIGGMLDLVEHEKNGYLATSFHSESLAKGIDYVVNHASLVDMRLAARETIVKYFDYQQQADQFGELCKQLLPQALN